MSIALCTPVRAQEPTASFKELRSSLKIAAGESVHVTTEDGKTLKGKIAGISDDAIAITVKEVRREMSESTVREIRRRQPDKWWNGALIGLGVGAGTGALVALGACGSNDPECQVIATAALVPTFAGIGAGAGALIDFAIRKYETVYAMPRTSNRGMRVSPILSKDRKGVRVAFSF